MKYLFFLLCFCFATGKSESEKVVAENRRSFRIEADSVVLTVSCVNDRIIHVQAVPKGAVPKASLVVLEDHGLEPSVCQV